MIWILIFLVLTALTIVLIQTSIGAYLDYGVTSAYSVVLESPSQFPAITICAASPFSSRADVLFNQIALNNSMNIHHSVISVLKLAKMQAANPSFGDENRKNLGLSFDMIVSCKFNLKDCKNDLHWIWLFEYGNCFQFNSGLN